MNIYEVYLLRNMLISYSRNSCQTIWHEVVYSELTEKQNKTALNYSVRADDAATFTNFLGPMLSDVSIAYGKAPAELGWAGRLLCELQVVILN